MDAIELSLFASRMQAACDEMGGVLRRTALSPNIKDRLDYSCALFDASGRLVAQAAHIPVHLGSMAHAMASVVARFDWRAGDLVMFNDPFLGGTHLPDVTVVSPVFARGVLLGFAASRAHHADIGAVTPGSMPLSTTLEEEGVVIAPMLLARDGEVPEDAGRCLATLFPSAAPGSNRLAAWQRIPAMGDFAAQISGVRIGAKRVGELAQALGEAPFQRALVELDAYAERLARNALAVIPEGVWHARDHLDDDGQGTWEVPLAVSITVPGAELLRSGHANLVLDFEGTSAQVPGNVNCPLSVAVAAAIYVFRCLMPPDTPASAGAFAAIEVRAPVGCMVNAQRPAAVTAGNVETSMRIVDLLLRALAPALTDRIPAASQGTMNNIAMGARGAGVDWDYYETLAGGSGAHARAAGIHAVHTHMTNTLNTPIESVESHYPLRVERYALRTGSGGVGRHPGGNGVERSYRFLEPCEVTLITERRRVRPWGLAGGGEAEVGRNSLNGRDVGGKVRLQVQAGDLLHVATPGGGGWGAPPED